MKKILIDGRVLIHSKITGVETHAIELIKQLRKITEIKIDVAIPKFKNKYYTHFWEHFILPWRAYRYDLLFCPSNIAPFFLPKKIKLIMTLHDLSFKDFPTMYSYLFRKYYEYIVPKSLQKAESVLTVSSVSYTRIVEEYPFIKNKLDFIYHGLSKCFFYNNKYQNENYILYIGSLNDTKNFSSVITAYNKLESTLFNLTMIMPSSKNFRINKEKQTLLHNAKKNKTIKILDYTSQENLVAIYQKATLFIFPSYHESFGLPPLEAMACGTPVITSNLTSMPEVCGDAAVYCDPYDIEDIKNKMELVLNDKNLQQEMIQKGLKRAKEFTWEKSAKEHLKVFKEVLDT